MADRYRFVWNRDEGLCYAISGVSGHDGVLDNLAGAWFQRLYQDPASAAVLSEEATTFLQECQSYGWLNRFGELQGSFVAVSGVPHLKRIQIELTTTCNLRCNYCYSESGPSQTSRLRVRDIFCILEQAAALGCMFVDLTGGEFFLFRDWREVLAYARGLGMAVSIHTNGTALTRSNLDELATQGVRRIQVSFDSHRAEVHDRVRGVQGAFDKSIQGILLAKQIGLPLRASLMVHQANRDHVGEMISWFANEIRIPINIDRLIAAGGEREARMAISPKDYFEIIAPYLSRRISSGRICENDSATIGRRHIEPHCGVAQSFVYVTADGEFCLCPTMTSRDNPAFHGPKISEMDLRQAWTRSTYFNSYRYTNCKNINVCPAGTACRGGCRSNAYAETGSLDSPDFVSCNLNKNATNTYVDFARRYAEGSFESLLKPAIESNSD